MEVYDVLLQVESVHRDDLLVGDCADLDADEHRVWSRVCSQVLREKRPSVTQPVRNPLLRELRLRHSLRLSSGDTGSPPRQNLG